MLLFDCFPAVNSLQNRFVQIHNDVREKNHFAPVKCKKYTEKVFLAFCGEFFCFAPEKLHKKFCCKMRLENVVLKMTEICQTKN